jgi:site-specific DNA recombinase
MRVTTRRRPVSDPYDRGMRAAIYTRISSDKEGRELGVRRQREDCRAYAELHGYTVIDLYEDNDRSASPLARKERPRYRKMINDATTGKFDVIIAYTSSRITRQVREYLDLIDLAKKRGIKYEYIKSPKHDLNTAPGRIAAKHEAVDNEGESDIISERVQADVDQRAKDGRFHGGPTPFGYQVVWSIVHRRERVTGFEVHPEHSKWLKEAARRVLAGESIYGICVDWNAKGRVIPSQIKDRPGHRWTSKSLRTILLNPANVGKRRHQGELHKAPWPAILSERDHTRLVALLTDPERKISTTNQKKYILSGLLFCALCGNRLTSSTLKKNSAPSYDCSTMKTGRPGCGKVKIVMPPLEQYITEAVFFALDTDQFSQAVADHTTEGDSADAGLDTVRQAITDDEGALLSLADEKDDKLITDAEYRRRRARINGRLDKAREELTRLTRSSTRATLPTGDELRRVWATKDNVWRHTMLSAVIERVDVGPHPRGVSSAPPRRRGEGETAWRERFDAVRMETMAQRTTIHWLA